MDVRSSGGVALQTDAAERQRGLRYDAVLGVCDDARQTVWLRLEVGNKNRREYSSAGFPSEGTQRQLTLIRSEGGKHDDATHDK